jgi:glyoxylase I family protein
MIKGMHHTAINVRDFDKSLDFYTTTLGLKQTMAWGEKEKKSRAAMIAVGGGSHIEIFEHPDYVLPAEGNFAGILHLAFAVDNCDEMLEKARAWGCEVTVEPKSVTIQSGNGVDVRIAFCKGPDGEIMEFFQNS